MISWLLADAFMQGDIAPKSANGLTPCISMYLGIQYTNSRSVILSLFNHFPNSSVFLISKWVLSLFEQRRRWCAVSLLPQFGHLLSGNVVPKYSPTCTLVPQKPDFCLDCQILYMSGLFLSAKSRCSQSTSSNCSFGHELFFLLPKYFLAAFLLAWNLMEWEMSLVILFPQITTTTSFLGGDWVGRL